MPADIFTVERATPSAEERFFTEALMSETVMAALGLTLVSRKLNLEFFTSAEATFHCQGLPAFSVVFASASFWAALVGCACLGGHEIEAGGGHDGVDDGRVEQDAVDVDGTASVSTPSLTEAVLAETSVDLPCFT